MNTIFLWIVTALYLVQAAVAYSNAMPAASVIMLGYVVANLGLIWSMQLLIRHRLSTTDREKLYDSEAAKARELGLGDLPICNICGTPIDGVKSAWDESHNPKIPHWLGGEVTGIAHRRCNRQHNNEHDTPLYWKTKRVRQRYIGARATASRPMPGTHASGIKIPMRPRARPIDRRTGKEL